MVRITGAKAYSARLKRISGPQMERAVGAALLAGADAVAAEAAVLISTGGGAGKNHIVSRPGEPPNEEFGTLNDPTNLRGELVNPRKAIAVADAPHAVPLEFGTSKMAERPFMRPAVARTRKEVIALIRRAVRDVVVGGKRLPGEKGGD